jgi:hypothetical protein
MTKMSESSFEKESIKFGNISLLLAIFSMIFVVPLFSLELHSVLYNALITIIFLMTVLAASKHRRTMLFIVIFLIALEWISSELDLIYLTGFSRIGSIFFFIFIVFRLIFQAAAAKDVDLNVVLESINGYLLLGVVFSIMVKIIVLFSPESYNFTGGIELSGANISSMSDYYYYGFVTYTTLGYGDMLPQLPFSKSLAILTSVCGQIYVAVIIAMLVGKYASRAQSNS